MSAQIDVTLLQVGATWTATFAVVRGLAPSSAQATDPATAIDLAREATLTAVFGWAPGQGLTIGPFELVLLEVALRNAGSTALYAAQNPDPGPVAPDHYGYGVDVSTFAGSQGNDLDQNFAPITGQQAIGEVVARRFLTPTGSLPEAPGEGIDVRSWIGKGWTTSQLRALEAQCAAEAERDERVASAKAKVTFTGQSLTLALSLQTSAGPFSLVLTVAQLAQNLQILQAA